MRSQDCGHYLEIAQVQGHQHSVLSRIAAVGRRTSATSSDFAQPKARNVTVGSTSYKRESLCSVSGDRARSCHPRRSGTWHRKRSRLLVAGRLPSLRMRRSGSAWAPPARRGSCSCPCSGRGMRRHRRKISGAPSIESTRGMRVHAARLIFTGFGLAASDVPVPADPRRHYSALKHDLLDCLSLPQNIVRAEQ